MMIYVRVFLVWLSCLCGLTFQQRYSKGWDRKLNELLDNHEIKTGYHTIHLGGYTIWTSNRYYSYAYPHGCSLPEVRPSIKTMLRLADEIEKQMFK